MSDKKNLARCGKIINTALPGSNILGLQYFGLSLSGAIGHLKITKKKKFLNFGVNLKIPDPVEIPAYLSTLLSRWICIKIINWHTHILNVFVIRSLYNIENQNLHKYIIRIARYSVNVYYGGRLLSRFEFLLCNSKRVNWIIF